MFKPMSERTSDGQYSDLLEKVLLSGEALEDTPQDKSVRMIFGELRPLVYRTNNGVPIITERKMGWRAPIGEMCAFINGVQDFDRMKSEFGVPEPFWGPWVTEAKTTKVHALPRHLGDASYGPAMATFPMPDGKTFDQFEQVVKMLQDEKLRHRRTLLITPWIPYLNGWGSNQQAVVSPCHGWMHFRVINESLHLLSWHRSADLPLGFANDMIAYGALLLMVSQVTGIPPYGVVFQFGDAHIYEDQFPMVEEMISREPRHLPTLSLDSSVTKLRDFRSSHFEIAEYNPHPPIGIPGSV